MTNYGAPGGLQSGNGKTISVVDLRNRQIIDTITVDLAPSALALSSNNKYLYVMCYVDGLPGNGKLDIIQTKTNKIIKTISGFFGPFGIVVSKDCHYAYVSNFGSNNFSPYGNEISVVDLHKYKIIKNIKVGIQPSGIAITEKYLYISNYNSLYADPIKFLNLTYGEGTINIICLKTNKVIDTISVGQTPSTLTLSYDEKNLYVSKYVQNTIAKLNLQNFMKL